MANTAVQHPDTNQGVDQARIVDRMIITNIMLVENLENAVSDGSHFRIGTLKLIRRDDFPPAANRAAPDRGPIRLAQGIDIRPACQDGGHFRGAGHSDDRFRQGAAAVGIFCRMAHGAPGCPGVDSVWQSVCV